MQKISMLFLAVFLLSCQPEELEMFTELDFSVKSKIQGSKEKNEANRVRVRNIEALRKLPFPSTKNRKEVFVSGYYDSGDGGGGIFYWDPISIEDDNGGTIISLQNNETGRWKREYKDTINIRWFGAKENPDFDNSSSLQKAIDFSKEEAKILEIHGRYKINSTVFLNLIDGLTIQGNAGSEIYTMDVIRLFSAKTKGIVKNLTFKNLKFSNYSQSLLPSFDLFHFEEVCLKNILFQFCQFTAPKINSNAIKFINQNDCLTENISFSYCQFFDLGRMGIEIQNHNYYDLQIRYKNIRVTESTFTNLGNLSFGMGISLSGYGNEFVAENNTFKGYSYAGIEIVGCSNNLINGNNFAGGEGGGIKMSG
ncbi:MAG: hypothetical protein O2U61_00205, partial [Candidatus Bathyarchaeota archaeon]|nr:hypothetical protein [Candidatus Bathyarchaeota archaeon]